MNHASKYTTISNINFDARDSAGYEAIDINGNQYIGLDNIQIQNVVNGVTATTTSTNRFGQCDDLVGTEIHVRNYKCVNCTTQIDIDTDNSTKEYSGDDGYTNLDGNFNTIGNLNISGNLIWWGLDDNYYNITQTNNSFIPYSGITQKVSLSFNDTAFSILTVKNLDVVNGRAAIFVDNADNPLLTINKIQTKVGNEGNIKFNIEASATNFSTGTVEFATQTGTGNSIACLYPNGTLYRGNDTGCP